MNNVTLVGYTFAPAACGVLGSDTSSGNDITLTFTSLNAGCQVTVDYTAQLTGAVAPDEILVNDANVFYTSLPGNFGTTSNPTGSSVTDVPGGVEGERNGTGATPPNDYTDTVSANVTAHALDLVKSLVGSSNPDTTDPDLTIGEIATYRLATVIPEGTSLAFTVIRYPPGWLYLCR